MGARVSPYLGGVIGSEIAKLRTLPAVPGTVLTTILFSAGLGALFGSIVGGGPQNIGPGEPGGSVAAVALQFVDLGQVGFILLGVLAVASEYPRSQIRTSLLGVPNRLVLLAGKAIAYLLVATPTAMLAVGGAALASILTMGGAGVSDVGWAREFAALAGAAVYLVLIGLLGFAVAVLVRNLVVASAVLSTSVLVLSPILTMFTELARYLPDQAGSRLFRSGSGLADAMGALEGAAVLVAWIVLIASVAMGSFVRRDA